MPAQEEIYYQKLQKWNVNQVELFLTKFLVFGQDFARIAGFFADNRGIRGVINLYWIVKKQFQLTKKKWEVDKIANCRWQAIVEISKKIISEWFAVRDCHGT